MYQTLHSLQFHLFIALSAMFIYCDKVADWTVQLH